MNRTKLPEPSPEYECSAFGQDHYVTFDGRMVAFHDADCPLILMQGYGVTVVVNNEACLNSFELQICRRVTITQDDGADIELFQKEFTVDRKTYQPGEYPETCSSVSSGVEIFQIGLFLIVRLYEKGNPEFVKFEVMPFALVLHFYVRRLGLATFEASFTIMRSS